MREGTIFAESRVYKNQNHSPCQCRVAPLRRLRCPDAANRGEIGRSQKYNVGQNFSEQGSIRFEINRQINATTRQTPSADAVDQQNKVIKAKSIEKQTFTARNEQKVILCQASLLIMNPCYQFPVSVEREREW
jgi:hypothetical protein